jgi:hypothetical protein
VRRISRRECDVSAVIIPGGFSGDLLKAQAGGLRKDTGEQRAEDVT